MIPLPPQQTIKGIDFWITSRHWIHFFINAAQPEKNRHRLISVRVLVHKETKTYHCTHSCVDMEQTTHLLSDLSTPYTLQSETQKKQTSLRRPVYMRSRRRQIGTISKSKNVRLANVRPKTNLIPNTVHLRHVKWNSQRKFELSSLFHQMNRDWQRMLTKLSKNNYLQLWDNLVKHVVRTKNLKEIHNYSASWRWIITLP